MSLLTQIVLEEKRRIENMIAEYERALAVLPKGTLVSKTVKNNPYYYLQYRKGKKTVSEYVGRASEQTERVKAQIERRKQIEAMLKTLRGEYALARKMSGA